MSPTSLAGFRTRLRARIAACRTSLCVGIDPHVDALPPFFAGELARRGAAQFLTEYSAALIEASAGVVPAVKFQSAFFEAFGADGFGVLGRMLARARAAGLITILDAKRGDIASTMAAYGRMAFDVMDADALTVTPFMGWDVIEPLLPWLARDRGVYVVWVSSNAGGALVQDGLAAPLFERFAAGCRDAGVSEAFGVVLGATRAATLPPALRARLAEAALLVPGVGAQGGVLPRDIMDMIRAPTEAGGPTLVPQSRSLGGYDADVRSWAEFAGRVRARMVPAAAELSH